MQASRNSQLNSKISGTNITATGLKPNRGGTGGAAPAPCEREVHPRRLRSISRGGSPKGPTRSPCRSY